MRSASRQEYHFPQAGVLKPSHDDISRRAYEIYIRSGFIQGRCQHNWHQAECELQRNK